jgi:hypothetical protein
MALPLLSWPVTTRLMNPVMGYSLMVMGDGEG